MKKFIAINLIVFASLFLACEKQNIEPIDMPEGLYAIWVENNREDGIWEYEKANKFDENKSGFQIIGNGKFIDRKNSGWCGTPPISYSNYEGKWSKISDTLISVESQFWGGATSFQMEIVSINENELKIRYIYQDN